MPGKTQNEGETATPTVAPTPTLDLPPADEVAYAFLQGWQQGDYTGMYRLLSTAAQGRYPEGRFIATYEQAMGTATVQRVVPQIKAAFQADRLATISHSVTLQTSLAGDLDVQNEMILIFEQGQWKVDWSPALVFPQMNDGAFLKLTTERPPRGNIYDRNGLGLAVQGEQVQVEVGIVPAEVADEAALLERLSPLLGESPDDLKARYADYPPDWYVPLGRISAEAGQANYEFLESTPGIKLQKRWTRSYHPDLIAPHVVGFVGPIPQEEIEAWRDKGYNGDELVGRLGLERWGEPYLASERSIRLEILAYTGAPLATLADRPAKENRSLYTTFDRDFQKKVQAILGEQLGAIVVLEAQTGRVLALATYPSFDPNPFATGISVRQWGQLQADPRRPLLNRAAQGTYPLGSVFKIVTMIAGMQAGGLTADSTFVCRGNWTGLGPDWPKVCWLKSGHGKIALNRALTVSCDITFYQVGMILNGVGETVLPDYARLCGFGDATGIEIEEEAGLLPDPSWKIEVKGEGWAPGDAVNLAIGQGELQVTPLQAAVLLAAVGNGGTIYRPQLVEMIASDPSNPDWTFRPSVRGDLPLSAGNLAVIQESLLQVTAASYGTAYKAFKDLSVNVAGKTGTAESGSELPHSWFAGYAPAESPEIAIAVIVERSGEGSSFAAPLFRKVVEAYFQIEPTPTPGAPTPTATP